VKRILVGVLALALLVFAAAYMLRKPITLRLMDNLLARNLATDLIRELPDGLHVALCGAGSPLPDPNRSGPCTAVIAGKRLFIVDVGTGSSRNLSRMRIPQGQIEAIFLTHFHSDHIDGLGEVQLQRWVGGHDTPVPVHGPPGVEHVVSGFNVAYEQDRNYRVAHHGADVMVPSGHGGAARPFYHPQDGKVVTLIEDEGLVVTAFRVIHDPIKPAVGYRFDYAGRSVLISGDTVKSANLQTFAEGVDLLVHEALDPKLVGIITAANEKIGRERIAKITTDILDYHTTPVEAAEIARDAGVGHLLFNHIVPPLLLPPMVEIFVEGVGDVYSGPVTVGRDGTLVSLPAGSDRIEISERL
jgi:ribonuclease Z